MLIGTPLQLRCHLGVGPIEGLADQVYTHSPGLDPRGLITVHGGQGQESTCVHILVCEACDSSQVRGASAEEGVAQVALRGSPHALAGAVG